MWCQFNQIKRGLYRLVNLKLLLLAISYTVVLAASVPVEVEPLSSDDVAQIQEKQQLQETAINLSVDELRHPHFLRINPLKSGTQLTGQIKINGKFFQRFDRNLKINLSPYLTRGKNTIHISGKYRPANNSIQIELIGANNQVSQETGGNGYLNQVLIVEVK